MSIHDARRLLFRVAADPELLHRLAAVASRAEEDASACRQLGEMLAQLDPRVSLADCQRVRAELESKVDRPQLDLAVLRERVSHERVDALEWLRRAALSLCNYCEA